MFTFISRLIFGQHDDAPPTRLLFRFFDGQRWRFADPVTIGRGLLVGNIERLLDDIDEADPIDRRISEHELLKLIRAAFGVQEFRDDGGTLVGLTLTETLSLARQYLCWIRAHGSSLKHITSNHTS